MKYPDVKKFFSFSHSDGSSPARFERIVRGALWALCVLILALLILDGYIFYQYSYKVGHESRRVEYKIVLQEKLIQDLVAELKERQKLLESVERGEGRTLQNPFK
ncbi:MAG: hypothetical protein A3I44_00020 [Candidatus Sungbacteria bacterium RIFCSPLOWO2_02_FULL_51_17]|uniref:Uncharacterized protein n=1 Tax=Candidatus Sungbacteria bacterium RIFCSPHIGHO2_02_FULL_51_29 TaxID=1802273 RepID=A0A1G2KR63_9BACT|nr:MAG: hypothetical protein A2676_05455 [Candidatus Sungbacteria bacterium RIFCSPHIGHO2_01_FULL_51_22]OHA01764.1 MAG: hypothetical protein A3C16_02660 [Candidatus Sungbacteria bacterium RIFCSPHIGHO2_02_FULL_51_29]OHA07958.1 MAG: hypothetical protein A3B29_04150 [Candidatus Sungbacteria bacterium RIFCSPLOWO2_01_FULL_51_34]OHA11542.1 MAG: hypothetical protein A3I44_00020 [Candidatus Sungbacteria bacterium RIFCSPLOWO2_02_FULL_51_17]